MWPSHLFCRLLTVSIIFLSVSTICSISSFVLCSVHGTLIIRLHIHISNASSLRISSFCRVHVSLPYNDTTRHSKQMVSPYVSSSEGWGIYKLELPARWSTGNMAQNTQKRIRYWTGIVADDTYIILQLATSNPELMNSSTSPTTWSSTGLRQLKSFSPTAAMPSTWITGYSSRYVNRMLGFTLTNHLSVSDHVRDVISRWAQSLHALKIMRCHGMNSDALKMVYKLVVLAKLLYASPAWWGFATSSGRIEAHVRRMVRLNLYHDTDPTASRHAENADDTLFENTLANPQHVLHHLLPSRTHHSYKLRPRRHDCSLTVKSDARNFITRQLFKDMY